MSRRFESAVPRSSAKLARARAFTLVELMVALTGGLIFSVFVFMLTRDVSRFFRNETGLSDATTALLSGYQRLRTDVQRAGFLASPNFAKDLGRCPARLSPTGAVDTTNISGTPWSTYDLMRDLALARVTAGATTSTWLTANSLAPDQLILYGNYTTADQYPVRSYVAQNIYLDPNSEELARAGYNVAGTAAAAQAVLQRIFVAGTILRVVSADTGEEQYMIVSSATAGTTTAPVIALASDTSLIVKGSGNNCGIRGLGADLLVNPVNVIRYRLGTLVGNTSFAALYGGTGGTAGADAAWPRFDLLREELNPNSTLGVMSQEIVAEFAVDFRVGVQVANATSGALEVYAAGHADIPRFLGQSTAAPATQANNGPQLIRALEPRLAIRSRVPDRQAGISGGLYRVPLTTGSGGAAASDYARVRTLQSFIMTRNTRNRVWN